MKSQLLSRTLSVSIVAIAWVTVLGETPGTKTLDSVCLIRHLDEIDVPAKRDGTLTRMEVRRGTTIERGQIVT